MKVVYRITDIPSTNPSPWSQEDKRELNRVCLRSFVKGFSDIRPQIHFIADHCDISLDKMIDDTVPFDYEIEHTKLGINATMLRSYEIAIDANDFVLFQECDYLYRPKIGKTFLAAIEDLKLVSPYDHKNFYIDKSLHSSTCDLQLVNGYHFRTAERNTMTWGCHSSLVIEMFDELVKQGYLDDVIWEELLYAGYPLWVPIPSFATHCVKDYLAPGVDWEAIWQKNQ